MSELPLVEKAAEVDCVTNLVDPAHKIRAKEIRLVGTDCPAAVRADDAGATLHVVTSARRESTL